MRTRAYLGERDQVGATVEYMYRSHARNYTQSKCLDLEARRRWRQVLWISPVPVDQARDAWAW